MLKPTPAAKPCWLGAYAWRAALPLLTTVPCLHLSSVNVQPASPSQQRTGVAVLRAVLTYRPVLLCRFFLCFIAESAILSATINLVGAVYITVRRIPLWLSFYYGFGYRRLYGFIPLGLWAGIVAGAATASIYLTLRRHPAAPWLHDTMHALATFLAALAVGHCCGPEILGPKGDLLGDATKTAYMAWAGGRVARWLRMQCQWSPAALDL